MAKKVEEELDIDLDIAIESFQLLSGKQWDYVEKENWSQGTGLKSISKMYTGNYSITELTLTQAVACLQLALKFGFESSDKIAGVIGTAKSFFDLFEERYKYFIENKTYDVFLKEDAEETSKNENYFSELVVFETRITKAYSKFKTQLKTLESADRNKHMSFPTFNDIPIPFLMKDTIEDKHPEIRNYLQTRINNEKQKLSASATPKNKSGKGNGIPGRPKKKKS